MTEKQFEEFLRNNSSRKVTQSAEEDGKRHGGMSGFSANLSMRLFVPRKDDVGVSFYSGVKLKEHSKVYGPWLATVLKEFFAKKDADVRVSVPPRTDPKEDSKSPDEGATVWVCIPGIMFNESDVDDERVKGFGKGLLEFIDDTFGKDQSAKKSRREYYNANRQFVENYANRRLASGEGLSDEELENQKIQENDAMTDNAGVKFVKPCFWKFSCKSANGKSSETQWDKGNKVIAMQDVESQTDSPTPRQYQRELFRYSLRKGDFVYICEEGRVCQLVQIDNDLEERPEDMVVKRHYRVIKELPQPLVYNHDGEKGMVWEPSAETTFVRVAYDDRNIFSKLILQQCFTTDVASLLSQYADLRVEARYWLLMSSKELYDEDWQGFNKMKEYDYWNVYGEKKEGKQRRRRREQRAAFISCREGDIVLGYDGAPEKKVSTLLVCSDIPYLDTELLDENAKICFNKKVHLEQSITLEQLKKKCGVPQPRGTLIQISPEQYRKFMDLAKKGNPDLDESILYKAISLSTEEKTIRDLLEANLNVILTGAPGTGKTYSAKRIAFAITGDTEATSEEESHIAAIQFHPGYDYSDFVIGMKPKLIGEKGKEQVAFDWERGVFQKFAAKARKAYDAVNGKEPPKFVFLIDEINRADLSRVFGELFSLLEEEYRYPRNKNGIRLPNGESFVIPENLYIIGTMNDIDRSVESMDFALRRRFAWYEVTAESSKHIIRKKVSENWKGNPERLEEVIGRLEEAMGALNEMIAPKSSKGANVADNQDKKGMPDLRLGSEYQLGGAIFAKFEKYQKDGDDAFRKLWHNHIENILKEYLRGRSDRDGQNGVMNKLKNAYGKAVGVTMDPE